MERRLSPRLSRAADRRDRGVLRRLSQRVAAHRAGAGRRVCLSGRAIAAPGGPAPRRAEFGIAGDGLRQFFAEPRPDRQPRAGRAAVGAGTAGGAGGGACRHAARARAAADVHGRRMGHAPAVSILLRFPGRACRFRPKPLLLTGWPNSMHGSIRPRPSAKMKQSSSGISKNCPSLPSISPAQDLSRI